MANARGAVAMAGGLSTRRRATGGAVGRTAAHSARSHVTTITTGGEQMNKHVKRDELIKILRKLIAWEHYMGGWESEIWKEAREIAKRLDKERRKAK
jgi:hypothetical protein